MFSSQYKLYISSVTRLINRFDRDKKMNNQRQNKSYHKLDTDKTEMQRRASKRLSYVLRYGAAREGLTIHDGVNFSSVVP